MTGWRDPAAARDPYAAARVESAARLAVSDRWTDRLAAGHLLAHESGDEQVDALLRHLLHDQHDTAVTEATAEALLGRHDITGVALTLEAWRDADDHTGEHLGDVFLRVCHDPGTDPGSFDTELLAVRTARPELADVVDEVRGWLGLTTVELVAPHEEIVIRPYRHSDAESWLRCRVLSFLHTQYFDDVKTERTVFDGPALCLVAVPPGAADDEVVGILDIEIDGAAATIDTVAVHPDHERRGLARRLLEQALPQRIGAGVQTVDAWTREDEPANRWYRARGFREHFRYLHVYADDSDGETGFRPPPGLGAPLKVLAHAAIEREAELRARHRRVHQCRQYLLDLR